VKHNAGSKDENLTKLHPSRKDPIFRSVEIPTSGTGIKNSKVRRVIIIRSRALLCALENLEGKWLSSVAKRV